MLIFCIALLCVLANSYFHLRYLEQMCPIELSQKDLSNAKLSDSNDVSHLRKNS